MADFAAYKTKVPVKSGSVAQSIVVGVVSSLGAPQTGLSNATAGILCTYQTSRGVANALSLSSLAAVTSPWNGAGVYVGFIELSSTLSPGKYRLDLPNAVFAGTDSVEVTLFKSTAFHGAVTIPTPTYYIDNSGAAAEAKIDIIDTIQDGNKITVDAIAAGVPFLDVANSNTSITTH